MKVKAAISSGAPTSVVEALRSPEFVGMVLQRVVQSTLGATDAVNRPAEYYAQEPDFTIPFGEVMGVELRLSGVSRNGRTGAQFHMAAALLVEIASETIAVALAEARSPARVQLFCVVMLDDQIETPRDSGLYSSMVEPPAVWVTAKGSTVHRPV